MSDVPARTFSADFRRFFLRGLVVLLPSVLTLWIVVKAYQFVDKSIAQPVNSGVRLAMVQVGRVWEPMNRVEAFQLTPAEIAAERVRRGLDAQDRSRDARIITELRARKIETWWHERWYLDFIGLAVAIIAVYVAGRLLGGFVGRRLYRKVETVIVSLPVFKQVYPYVKQIVDFLFSDDRPLQFNRVVMVQYPRQGIWSVGFQTGESLRSVAAQAGDVVSVFIPSSPTPFTGYTITVPRDEVVELPISVEEAIRFAVSGGVLVPDHQMASPRTGSEEAPAGGKGAPRLAAESQGKGPAAGTAAEEAPADDEPARDAG